MLSKALKKNKKKLYFKFKNNKQNKIKFYNQKKRVFYSKKTLNIFKNKSYIKKKSTKIFFKKSFHKFNKVKKLINSKNLVKLKFLKFTLFVLKKWKKKQKFLKRRNSFFFKWQVQTKKLNFIKKFKIKKSNLVLGTSSKKNFVSLNLKRKKIEFLKKKQMLKIKKKSLSLLYRKFFNPKFKKVSTIKFYSYLNFLKFQKNKFNKKYLRHNLIDLGLIIAPNFSNYNKFNIPENTLNPIITFDGFYYQKKILKNIKQKFLKRFSNLNIHQTFNKYTYNYKKNISSKSMLNLKNPKLWHAHRSFKLNIIKKNKGLSHFLEPMGFSIEKFNKSKKLKLDNSLKNIYYSNNLLNVLKDGFSFYFKNKNRILNYVKMQNFLNEKLESLKKNLISDLKILASLRNKKKLAKNLNNKELWLVCKKKIISLKKNIRNLKINIKKVNLKLYIYNKKVYYFGKNFNSKINVSYLKLYKYANVNLKGFSKYFNLTKNNFSFIQKNLINKVNPSLFLNWFLKKNFIKDQKLFSFFLNKKFLNVNKFNSFVILKRNFYQNILKSLVFISKFNSQKFRNKFIYFRNKYNSLINNFRYNFINDNFLNFKSIKNVKLLKKQKNINYWLWKKIKTINKSFKNYHIVKKQLNYYFLFLKLKNVLNLNFNIKLTNKDVSIYIKQYILLIRKILNCLNFLNNKTFNVSHLENLKIVLNTIFGQFNSLVSLDKIKNPLFFNYLLNNANFNLNVVKQKLLKKNLNLVYLNNHVLPKFKKYNLNFLKSTPKIFNSINRSLFIGGISEYYDSLIRQDKSKKLLFFNKKKKSQKRLKLFFMQKAAVSQFNSSRFSNNFGIEGFPKRWKRLAHNYRRKHVFRKYLLSQLFGDIKAKQLVNLYKSIKRHKFLRTQKWVSQIECRLDISLLRLNFVPTISLAQYIIRKGLIFVNGLKLTNPLIIIKTNSLISMSSSLTNNLVSLQKFRNKNIQFDFNLPYFQRRKFNSMISMLPFFKKKQKGLYKLPWNLRRSFNFYVKNNNLKFLYKKWWNKRGLLANDRINRNVFRFKNNWFYNFNLNYYKLLNKNYLGLKKKDTKLYNNLKKLSLINI